MGKPSGEKNFLFVVVVISLVKFRNLKTVLPRSCKEPLSLSSFLFSLHSKRSIWENVHCLLLVPKALPGETYTPGSLLMSQEDVDGRWLLICTTFSLLAVLVPKHVFSREINSASSLVVFIPF